MRWLETETQIGSSGNTSKKKWSSQVEFPRNILREIQMKKSQYTDIKIINISKQVGASAPALSRN